MSWRDSAKPVDDSDKSTPQSPPSWSPPAPTPEEGWSVGEFGDNFVDSAVTFGGDMIQMPKDLLWMMWTGLTQDEMDTDNPTVAGFKALATEEGRAALGDYYAERYGGLDNIGETFYEDPVGFLSDIAMMGMPAMAAKNLAKGAAKAGVKGGESAAEVFQKTQQMLEKADPLNIAGMLTTTAVNKAASADMADKLYTEVIKPPTGKTNRLADEEVRRATVRYMLENGIRPDADGIAYAQARIDDALARSDDLVEGTEGTMPAGEMLTYYEQQANPTRDVIDSDASAIPRAAQAQARLDQLGPYYGNAGPEGPLYRPDLTAEQVRDQRRSADAQVNWNRKPQAKADSESVKLDKGQANHLREQLGEIVPEIKEVNEQISKDLDAQAYAEIADKRNSNNNTIGLSDSVVAAGGLASDNWLTGLLAGLVSNTVRSPKNRARAARYIYRAQNDPLVFKDSPYQGTRSLLQYIGRPGEYVYENIEEDEDE